MIEHDKKLYDEALKLRRCDYARFEMLESLCLTEEGAEAIRSLEVMQYHKEEAQAGMI